MNARLGDIVRVEILPRLRDDLRDCGQPFAVGTEYGRVNEQTLLFLDLAGKYRFPELFLGHTEE